MAEDKTLSDEISEIVTEAIQKALVPIEFPTEMKVEVLNQPPKIDFSGVEKSLNALLQKKEVTILPTDTKKIEDLLVGIQENLDKPNNSEVLGQLVKAIESNKAEPIDLSFISESMSSMVEEIRKIKERPINVRGGGAVGPSKFSILDLQGKAISPSTSTDTLKGKNRKEETVEVGVERDSLKVTDSNTRLLKEILVELKINNLHLAIITGDTVKEADIK